MKLTEFVKKELQGWSRAEITGLGIVLLLILVNSVILKDSIQAVINAICGILYTITAGKGKISCYIFGLTGSSCYIWLSYKNALWGNMLLYLCYYIPMQITGIFKWKKHLKEDTREIKKIKLSKKENLIIIITSIAGCLVTIFLLGFFNDKNPFIDGITSFLSILGMYLTVKRAVEQWIIWMIVNGLSFVMWLNLVLHGTKAYATVIMWGVYFMLAIYFYIMWQKELKSEQPEV